MMRQKFDVLGTLGVEGAMWVGTKQASRWYGCNDRTVRKWIASGRIRETCVAVAAGGSYLVKIDLVDRTWPLSNSYARQLYSSVFSF